MMSAWFRPLLLMLAMVAPALGILEHGWAGSDGKQDAANKSEQSHSAGESDTAAKGLLHSIRRSAKPIEQDISRGAAKAARLLTGQAKEKATR